MKNNRINSLLIKKKIYLSIYGDINNHNAWSGTGFYALMHFQNISNRVFGISLNTEKKPYKFSRFFWNIKSFLKNNSLGGYQYSEEAINLLWRNYKNNLDNTTIINFFPLYPKFILENKLIDKVFYIDLTINQLFKDYGSPKFLSKEIKKKILDRELKGYFKSKYIFVHSNYVKKDLINTYGISERKIATIVPGANFPIFDSRKIDSFIREKKSLKITFIGKDLYRKGLDRVIKSLMICESKDILCELNVIGNFLKSDKRFTDFQDIKFIKEYGPIDKIKDLDKFICILNSSDFGILMSRSEAGGMALREFGLFGIPTISTRVGGIEDHASKTTGIIIDGKDEESLIMNLTRKIENYYRNRSELNELKKKARDKVDDYKWYKSLEKIIDKLSKIPK